MTGAKGDAEQRKGTAHALLGWLADDPAYGPLPGLLLVLTVVTGVVDAVSILSLGRVFVANMTGNIVFAAFAVVGAPGFSLAASLFAVGGFLVGAYLGGSIIARTGPDRGALLRAGTAVELAGAGVALLIAAVSGAPGTSHGTLGLLVGAAAGASLTLRVSPLSALALATALLAAAAIGAAAAARRPGEWRTPPRP